MNSAGSLFSWSFPIGNWFATTVRVSILTPLLAVVLMYQLGPRPGLIATVIVLLSLLAHEFAHIFSARATGGYGDEIVISPFGGVALVQTGGTFLSRLIVPASGPILNLAVCAGLVPILLGQDQAVRSLMNPMNYGEGGGLVLASQTSAMVCQLAFVVNWLLVLINLIPVHPLDGGRMLQAVLTEQYGAQTSNMIYLKVGTIAGVVFVFGGLLFNSAVVVAIGTFILVINLEEMYRMRTADAYDDSFMGYDFSQGYTSLERDSETDLESSTKKGMFAAWRERKKEEREEAERLRAEEDAKLVDDILSKLHESGYDSLNDSEKRVLKRASNRYKNQQDKT
ncbi:MAG: site-2 protease family protein [Planctomycetaceae bacterium]